MTTETANLWYNAIGVISFGTLGVLFVVACSLGAIWLIRATWKNWNNP